MKKKSFLAYPYIIWSAIFIVIPLILVIYEITVKENDRSWILHNTKNAEVGSYLGMDIYPEDIHIMKKVSE